MHQRITCFLTCSLICILLVFDQAQAIPAHGQNLMIAGPSPYGVEVGKDIARKGGNVVDVAVGVALSLAVTHPYYAALGGGGFALIKVGSEIVALDFRESAPLAANEKMFVGKPENASRDGGLAVAVPGLPAGLWELHKKYGKLSWSKLFSQPIALAEKGFAVSGEWSRNTALAKDRFNSAGKKFLLRADGVPSQPGQVLKQPQLAKVLKEVSHRGITAFYSGQVAQDIVNTVQETGGALSLKDFEKYHVRWLDPLVADFQGYKLYLMPPPSSGGVIIQSALRMAEISQMKARRPLSSDELHGWAEILKLAFLGRQELGDPRFHDNPIARLTSDAYLNDLVKRIKPDQALAPEQLKNLGPHESEQTTHFSVMDQAGNAVAMTLTLNGNYGSAVVSQKFGVALNNQMDDFTTRPNEPNLFGLVQGQGNRIEAGKRPLSSMSPSIVLKDGKTALVIGAPGGPRIISGVIQVLYRTLVNGWDMDWAIQAPRVHHQYLPNTLYVDPLRFPPESIAALTAKGHKIEETNIARVYGIKLSPEGWLEGAFDSRGEGAAGGF